MFDLFLGDFGEVEAVFVEPFSDALGVGGVDVFGGVVHGFPLVWFHLKVRLKLIFFTLG